MATNDKIEPIPKDYISLLDTFLIEYTEQALEKIRNKEEPKIGDLLKVLEKRIKINPESSEQKKFWKMIAKIRKEHQAAKEDENVKKKAS